MVVLYYSPTGATKKIAAYSGNFLGCGSVDLTPYSARKSFDYQSVPEYIVLCFPVYSQNIPAPVKQIMKKLQGKYFLLLATYGRMGTGNVLWEAKKLLNGIVIGGAYLPTKHSYKTGDYFQDYSKLDALLSRAKEKATAQAIIPKLRKNLFADCFPNLRSRIGVKIKKNNNCRGCNHCGRVCPLAAIERGSISNKCIRCLACFHNCPNQALEVKYSPFLKVYLKKDRITDLLIY